MLEEPFEDKFIICNESKTMARTKAPKGRRPSCLNEPLIEYNKLPVSYQLIVYKFWSYLEFGNTILWNPDKTPNTINNYRSST